MDNNTPNNGNDLNQGQPMAQPTPEPMPEPKPEPTPEPAPAPMPEPQPTPFPEQPHQPNNDGPTFTDSTKDKKHNLAVICGVIAFIVAAIVVGLFVFFGVRGGGEKTVTCTMSATQMGISSNIETNVNVKDGEISSGNVIVEVDLKTMSDSYKKYESTMVESLTKTYQESCDDDCTFNYDYIEGDSVKYTLEYGKDGVDNIVRTFGSFERLSAQEIADKVQKALESDVATCTQK